MNVIFEARRLAISDLVLVKPRRFADPRGTMAETYRSAEFAAFGISPSFVQDNEARSLRKGTLRGLHFQAPPHAQGKLVRVLKGAILDVAVDLRRGSVTYGRAIVAELTAESGEQLFVPRGFAHGYCTTEDDTIVAYKCDAYYAPAAEGGVHFADPELRIDWPYAPTFDLMSPKDGLLPRLADFVTPFVD